jgi:hypothetical protein
LPVAAGHSSDELHLVKQNNPSRVVDGGRESRGKPDLFNCQIPASIVEKL